MSSRSEFLASLPRKRITARALVRDRDGDVLLVEPTVKDHWLTPGGTVEALESPSEGVRREVQEELGVALPISRPLVMQWLRTDDDPHGVLHFTYDGGVIGADVVGRIRTPPFELRSCRFFDPAEVSTVASPITAARVAAALEAVECNTFIELG